MFAGEGGPSAPTGASITCPRACRRKRLSTAFDSVTLYGNDPDTRPDIYGKIGNSGVSISCLDESKKLYSGFNLCDSEDLGVDDHQRPGADDGGLLHERRHRPAVRELHR